MQCRAGGRNKAICCFQACPPQTYVFGGRAVQGSAIAPASSLRYAPLRWPLRALTIPHATKPTCHCRCLPTLSLPCPDTAICPATLFTFTHCNFQTIIYNRRNHTNLQTFRSQFMKINHKFLTPPM